MSQEKRTSAQYFKTLQIISYAFVAGVIMFGLVAYYNRSEGLYEGDGGKEGYILKIVVSAIAIGCYFIGNFLYKEQLKNHSVLSLDNKLAKFQTASLIKLALTEGPALFALVVYMITGSAIMLLVAVLLVIVILLGIPNKAKLFNDMDLTKEERALIEDDNAKVFTNIKGRR